MSPPSHGPGPLPASVGLFSREWLRARGVPVPARLVPWVDAMIVDSDRFPALESPAQLHDYREASRFEERSSRGPEAFVSALETLRALPYRHAFVTPLIDWHGESPAGRGIHDGLLVAVPFLAYLRHASDGRAHGGVLFPIGSDRQSRPLAYSYDDWPAALAALVDLAEAAVSPLAVMPVRELLARCEAQLVAARESRTAPLRRVVDRARGWSLSAVERRAGGVSAAEAVRRMSVLVDQLDRELREATGEGIAALLSLEAIGLRQGATALIPSTVAEQLTALDLSAYAADQLQASANAYTRALRQRRNARPATDAAEPDTPPPPPPPPDPAARRPEGRARRRVMFD